MAHVSLVYHGPPQFVPALAREVRDGDKLKGPASLAHAAGFALDEKPVKDRD